jgi:hypothetical protein
MKARIAFSIGAAMAGCWLLTGCGGNHQGSSPPVTMTPPPPPASSTKNLDTAAVLGIIQTQTSETADPFEVDNAAIAVTPVGDETSAPVSVDAP